MTTPHRLAALAVALCLVPGCASLPFRLPFRGGDGLASGFSQEDLRTELSGYAARFAAAVTTAGEEISLATDSRLTRRRALLWRLRMVPAVQENAFLPNAQEAYLNTLTIAVMMRQYLTDGDGRALFGAQQEIAAAAARQLEQDALDIGARFLSQAELARVAKAVDDLASRFPIQGTAFSFRRAVGARAEAPSSDAITSMLRLPLAPFRALEGVDSGAAAIREFNQTARRFASIVARLPEQVRGEVELLLYDVEDRDTVVQGLAAFESLAASADRASLAVARVPADIESALAEAEGPLAEAGRLVEQVQALAPSLAATGNELREASLAWRELLGTRDEREAGKTPADRPFDVREWADAAARIGTAAAELRALTADVDRLAGSGALAAAVDRAFWRGVALLVVLFALLLGYRVVAARVVGGARAG